MMVLKKSSKAVPLVLVGGAMFLTACSNNPDGMRKPHRGETRYDYKNRADCQKDWGEQACPEQESATTRTGSGRSGMYYFYRYEQNPRSKAQTNAIKVVRGGFGGSGRASS